MWCHHFLSYKIMSKEVQNSNPHWLCVTIQVWIVPLIGCATRKRCFLQSEPPLLPRLGQWDVISISARVPHVLIRRENLRWHHKMLANGTVVIIIFLDNYLYVSLRKQQTFGDATTGLRAKWHLRNERRNSILTTHHYPDLSNDASPVWNFCACL